MQLCAVAPFAGAWIEIKNTMGFEEVRVIVAPFAGAWIEIVINRIFKYAVLMSLPSRERGLK